MMLVGAPPYKAPQPQVAAFKYIIEGRVADVLKHWKRLSMLTEDAVDLLKRTMCYEKNRISMEDLLAHPFFKNVQDEVSDPPSPPNDDMKTSLKVPSDMEEQVSSMSIDNNQQEPPPSSNQQKQHQQYMNQQHAEAKQESD